MKIFGLRQTGSAKRVVHHPFQQMKENRKKQFEIWFAEDAF